MTELGVEEGCCWYWWRWAGRVEEQRGQVGLGGGRLDWGSKVVSALVVRPRGGRALLLERSQPFCLQTPQYQQHTHLETGR